MPTLVTFADVPDEERLDKACSCLMDGIHLLNEVSCRTRNRSSLLTAKHLKFKEAFHALRAYFV